MDFPLGLEESQGTACGKTGTEQKVVQENDIYQAMYCVSVKKRAAPGSFNHVLHFRPIEQLAVFEPAKLAFL